MDKVTAPVAAIAAATGVAVLGGTLYYALSRRNHAFDQVGGRHREKLPPIEKMLLDQKEIGITTVTFFKGMNASVAGIAFKRRLEEIVGKNLWLGGTIKDGYHLWSPDEEAKLKPGMFRVCEHGEVDFHRKSPLEDMESLKRFQIQAGETDLLFSLNLIPDSHESNRFAAVCSMSHVCGDGATYYKILNMLWGSTPITALNAKRKWDVHERMSQTFTTQSEVLTPIFFLSLVFRLVYGSLIAKEKKCAISLTYLDEAWVRDQKAQPTEGVDFISTNDALTSWFMKEAEEVDSNPCVGLMAVNARGRVENCEDTDAGNYEDMIYYLGPEDHGTPSLIRKSLKVMKRVGNTRMPSLLARLQMRGSLITNWCSFCIPPPTDTVLGCKFDLHVPFYRASDLPYGWSFLVIFKCNREKIGLCCGGLPAFIKSIKGPPLGEPIV